MEYENSSTKMKHDSNSLNNNDRNSTLIPLEILVEKSLVTMEKGFHHLNVSQARWSSIVDSLLCFP